MKKLIQNILLIGSIIFISGCDNNNLSLPTDKPKIDESLPILDVATIKFIPDMTSIALEWKATDVHSVKGYHIYRANIQEEGQKLKRVATVKNCSAGFRRWCESSDPGPANPVHTNATEPYLRQ